MFALVGDRGRHVEAEGVVDAAVRVGHRDHARALLREQAREVRADVAEALYGNACVVQPASLLLQGGADAVKGCREPVAPSRPTEPPIESGLPVTTPSTE